MQNHRDNPFNGCLFVAGMLGAGVLGTLLGLQVGVLFWLGQWLTGETVEQRWAREFAFILQQQDLEDAKRRAEDLRAQQVRESTGGEEVGEVVEREESEWKRGLVITLRQWAIQLGLITDYSIYKAE